MSDLRIKWKDRAWDTKVSDLFHAKGQLSWTVEADRISSLIRIDEQITSVERAIWGQIPSELPSNQRFDPNLSILYEPMFFCIEKCLLQRANARAILAVKGFGVSFRFKFWLDKYTADSIGLPI